MFWNLVHGLCDSDISEVDDSDPDFWFSQGAAGDFQQQKNVVIASCFFFFSSKKSTQILDT